MISEGRSGTDNVFTLRDGPYLSEALFTKLGSSTNHFDQGS